MPKPRSLFSALLAALALVASLAVAPVALGAPVAGSAGAASVSEKRTVCSNGRVYLVVRNISCKHGRKIIKRAERAFWEQGDGPNNVGKYRCTYPAYLGDIRCSFRGNASLPKRERKSVRHATE
ncbi:MAG: hypothetical protein CMH83_13650 [Nocardioides sp.]|nr:hypothetical protein [Nocardioides sp.]